MGTNFVKEVFTEIPDKETELKKKQIEDNAEIVALFAEMPDNGEILKHSIPELGIEYMYFLGEDEICEGSSLPECLREAQKLGWGK